MSIESLRIEMFTDDKFFVKFPRWLQSWICKAMTELKSIHVWYVAYLYMRMRDRAEISRKNEWVDEKGKVYIHYTYAEIKQLFNCGTTKAWLLVKMLKDYGFITVRYQGFGYPMMIYVNDPEEVSEESCEERSDPGEKTMPMALTRYEEACENSFSKGEMAKIEKMVREKVPQGESENNRIAFLCVMYEKLKKAEKKKAEKGLSIPKRFVYFLAMLKNSQFNRKDLLKKPIYAEKPSFDVKEFDEYARTHTPKL